VIFDETTYSSQWLDGFPLGPLPDTEGVPTEPGRFQTHSSLGALAPRSGNWQFEPVLPPGLEIDAILLLHCGYRIRFTDGRKLEMLQVRGDLWIGEMPSDMMPELFSPDQPVETGEHVALLDTGSGSVGLYHQPTGGIRRCVLRLSNEEPAALKNRLPADLDTCADPLALWERELHRRREWAARLPDTDQPGEFGPSLERLADIVRPPDGPFRALWVDLGREECPGLTPRALPGPLHAFALVRPELVRGLFDTLAALPSLPNGAWPEFIPLHNASFDGPPAPPLLAQQLAALPAPLVKNIPPELARRCVDHVNALLGDWTPESEGLPNWPDEATAFTPEIQGRNLTLFDLSSLLVAEMDACAALAGDASLFASERHALQERIWNDFWSEKRKVLLDRTADGTHARRVTSGTLLPLLWAGIPRDKQAALLHLLRNEDLLRAPTGIRQWEQREDDPDAPPVRLDTQHLLFPILRQAPSDISALLAASWRRLCREPGAKASPGLAALRLRLLPIETRVNPELERYPGWVRLLERHRNAIVGAAALVLFLAPVVAGIAYMNRPEIGRTEEYMESGHAQTLYSLERFQEAEEAYTRLLELTRDESRRDFYHLRRGNARYRQGKFRGALEDYRVAIELDEKGLLHTARWNLAQTYRELGDTEAALQALREFITEYGDELPADRTRAENAIVLLKP